MAYREALVRPILGPLLSYNILSFVNIYLTKYMSRLRYGGEEMLGRLGGVTSQAGGQTVILCHDVGLRPGGPGSQPLTTFLRLATQAGYQFRTINYFREE